MWKAKPVCPVRFKFSLHTQQTNGYLKQKGSSNSVTIMCGNCVKLGYKICDYLAKQFWQHVFLKYSGIVSY